jgi:hypothetical protein
LHPLVFPLLLDGPKVGQVLVLLLDLNEFSVGLREDIKNVETLLHVILTLSKVLTSHTEFSDLLLSDSSLLKVSTGFRLNSARALFVESLEVLSDVSLKVGNLRLHLLLLLLEVSGDDSVSLLHSNEEVSPGLIKGVDLSDVVFSKSFNFSRLTISFPSFDVLKLLLDGTKTGLPLLLLTTHFSVTLLVRLKHVQGGAVLLKLFYGIVEEVKELVQVVLRFSDQMLLDLSDQLASAFFLVVSKEGVIKLNEETCLSGGLVGHFLHVGLHLLDGGTVVSHWIIGISSFSRAQESPLTSISLHVHELSELGLNHLSLLVLF